MVNCALSGGVAVVKTHYPFARAYDLAEKLCDSAKSYIKESRFNEKGLTAMDRHFGVGGMVLELQEIRKREYMASTGSLLMRPISFLSVNQHEWRTWGISFTRLLRRLNTVPTGKTVVTKSKHCMKCYGVVQTWYVISEIWIRCWSCSDGSQPTANSGLAGQALCVF